MKSSSRLVVYTAVFGNYDRVAPPNGKWDCDFICFTDNPDLVSDGWQIVNVSLDGCSPVEVNRLYKMLPHRFLPSYEQSLYVDGNVKILANPNILSRKYLKDNFIAIPKHQDRDCIYEEAKICMEAGRVDREITECQMQRYANDGFPTKFGMTENGIIFRRHHDQRSVTLMSAWWDEYCNGGKRDQLSLAYLVWKLNVNVQLIEEGPRINTRYFEIALHESDNSKSFLVRLARTINGKKHLSYVYLYLSYLISFLVAARDILIKKMLKHTATSNEI
ncbi:glycosyltransferase domain-containing protein [Telluria sp. B2]